MRRAGQLEDIAVSDGEPVAAGLVGRALTAGRLVFPDGATQVFEAAGTTTYVEHGRPTRREWSVDDDGCFASCWLPAYRARHELRWIVAAGVIRELRFTEVGRGSRSDGRCADGSERTS